MSTYSPGTTRHANLCGSTLAPAYGTNWQASPMIENYLAQLRDDLPMHREQIAIMLRLIAAHGPTVQHFLDLGCGDGILGAMILERYPTASGVLVDFAEPMLRIASEKLHDYTPNLHFLNLDYGDPRWLEVVGRHAPFDLIVSGYSIHHQPDPHKQRVYREIHDLLAPGGLFINIEYVASASGWGEALFDTHMIQHLHTVKQQRGETVTWEQIAAAFYRLMYTPEDRQASIEQQCVWLRRIGFEDVDCFFKLFAFAVFGGRRSVGSPRT